MLAQAMKDAKPTNVRLGNPSCDHTSCGAIAHARHLKMPELNSWEGGTRMCDHLPTLHRGGGGILTPGGGVFFFRGDPPYRKNFFFPCRTYHT